MVFPVFDSRAGTTVLTNFRAMKIETLSKLRNGKPLRVLKPYQNLGKCFFQFQLNRNADHICWQRYVSKDRQNWVLLNSYLSLNDIDNFLKS